MKSNPAIYYSKPVENILLEMLITSYISAESKSIKDYLKAFQSLLYEYFTSENQYKVYRGDFRELFASDYINLFSSIIPSEIEELFKTLYLYAETSNNGYKKISVLRIYDIITEVKNRDCVFEFSIHELERIQYPADTEPKPASIIRFFTLAINTNLELAISFFINRYPHSLEGASGIDLLTDLF